MRFFLRYRTSFLAGVFSALLFSIYAYNKIERINQEEQAWFHVGYLNSIVANNGNREKDLLLGIELTSDMLNSALADFNTYCNKKTITVIRRSKKYIDKKNLAVCG